MAVLLITHDLGVVANLADEVVVVYDGKVMEAGPSRGYLQGARPPLPQGAAERRRRISTWRRRAADGAARRQARRAQCRRPRQSARQPADRPLLAVAA